MRAVDVGNAERATGLDEKRWQASLGPCLERTFATGRFPALATVVRDAAHRDADHLPHRSRLPARRHRSLKVTRGRRTGPVRSRP